MWDGLKSRRRLILVRTVILQKYRDDQVMTLCKWRMRHHFHDSTLPTPRLVVAGGSCWGGGRSVFAASTCFSKASCGWEMKDGTLQSNCHGCLGHTTNKGPPAWIIRWITALTCPLGSYFCLLKKPCRFKVSGNCIHFWFLCLFKWNQNFISCCPGKMSSLGATAYLTVLMCLLL